MGPIWDFDLGFGNVDYADATYPEGWWVRWNTWIARMLEDPAFASKVRDRYAQLDEQRPEVKEQIYGWAEQLRLSQAETIQFGKHSGPTFGQTLSSTTPMRKRWSTSLTG